MQKSNFRMKNTIIGPYALNRQIQIFTFTLNNSKCKYTIIYKRVVHNVCSPERYRSIGSVYKVMDYKFKLVTIRTR